MFWLCMLPGILLAIGAAVWLGYLYLALRLWRDVPRLARLSPGAPARWPKVSVIVPARDEARDVEAALRSKLAVDYPSLELVVVDDRSTDATGAIVDALAREDARVVPLHVTELPEGWLGKLHAMERGIQASSGEILLLSDADVHLAPGALRKVVAWAEQESLDHVAALPRVTSRDFVLQAIFQAAMRIVLVAFRPWAVRDPASTASAGIGAFNLVRRGAYDRTPGLSWIKLEVADDAALGQMLKLSGARCAIVNAGDDVSLRFYRTLGETARQIEKAVGVGGRRPWAAALASVLGWSAEMVPFALLAWPPAPLRLAAAAVCALAIADALLLAAWARLPLRSAWPVPLGSTLLAALSLRAAVLAAWRGGIVWRGTFYSRASLAAGARYRIWPRR